MPDTFTITDDQERLIVQQFIEREADREQVRKHYQAFELKAMACQNLDSLLSLLLMTSLRYFSLTGVSLWLVDKKYTLKELIGSNTLLHYKNHLQLRHNQDFLCNLYQDEPSVILHSVTSADAVRVFPTSVTCNSMASIPLMRQDTCIGSLHFASDDIERFSQDKSTEVLEHFAQVVSLCLENSINKEYLIRQNYRDLLTQVDNRLSFNDRLPKLLSQAIRTKLPLSCAFIDVDHFKDINDQYGHQAGDIGLKSVAKVINDQLRTSDFLARYGGEEFVILLPDCSIETAEAIAERARVAVFNTEVVAPNKARLRLTVSIGVACFDEHILASDPSPSAEHLILSADKAMYRAKNMGRNQVVVYSGQ